MGRPSANNSDDGLMGELISVTGAVPPGPGPSRWDFGCNDGSLASDIGGWRASDADRSFFDSEFRTTTSHIVLATIFAHFLPLCVPKTQSGSIE